MIMIMFKKLINFLRSLFSLTAEQITMPKVCKEPVEKKVVEEVKTEPAKPKKKRGPKKKKVEA